MYTGLRQFIEDNSVYKYISENIKGNYQATLGMYKNRFDYIGDFRISWHIPKYIKLDESKILFQGRPLCVTECKYDKSRFAIKGVAPIPQELYKSFTDFAPIINIFEKTYICNLKTIAEKEMFIVFLKKNSKYDSSRLFYHIPMLSSLPREVIRKTFPNIIEVNKHYSHAIVTFKSDTYLVHILRRGYNTISLQKLK